MARIESGTWQHRFGRLQALAGVTREHLSQQYRLEGAPSPPTLEQLTLSSILRDPPRLYERLGKDLQFPENPRERRAHVSVLQQQLALDVIAPLALRALLDGHTPVVSATEIFLLPAGGTYRWHWWEGAQQQNPERFTRQMAKAVKNWYPVFRTTFGVSPGAYWSSIGLAFGMPFSALYGTVTAEQICPLATRWLAEFDCDAQRYIDWIEADIGGRRYGIPQRRGCCLKFQLPGGSYCGTCGVYRRDRLAALRTSAAGATTPGQWCPQE